MSSGRVAVPAEFRPGLKSHVLPQGLELPPGDGQHLLFNALQQCGAGAGQRGKAPDVKEPAVAPPIRAAPMPTTGPPIRPAVSTPITLVFTMAPFTPIPV